MDGTLLRVMDGIKELAHIPKMARIFVALMADGRVPLWLKICVTAGAIYVASPIDIIPDFITGIGYLDDVIMVVLIIQTFIDMAPQAVVLEHCAALGIDPRELQVDITRAVSSSIGAVLPFIEGRRGGGSSEPRTRPEPQGSYSVREANGAAGEEDPGAVQPEDAPRHLRYSAYRSEQA
jgi:uncharacterized membrane protein YkvA (DUF1232 family)